MQAPRSRRVSPSIEASQCARIPSPPAEPPIFVLWLNQVTRWFCGESPQTPCVDYPAPTPIHDFVLLFLPPCDPHLIPFDHRVHRAEPTCLSTPRRPRKAKTFRSRSSPAPMQIKPQPAPVILGKSHSTPRCQSLITPGSDHPPVLGRSGPHLDCGFITPMKMDNLHEKG
jgi:hypothetical protein